MPFAVHSVEVSMLALIKVDNRHWAQLILEWVNAHEQINVWVCKQLSRSTQPSTLCGMVKWVSAFGLSNNKLR